MTHSDYLEDLRARIGREVTSRMNERGQTLREFVAEHHQRLDFNSQQSALIYVSNVRGGKRMNTPLDTTSRGHPYTRAELSHIKTLLEILGLEDLRKEVDSVTPENKKKYDGWVINPKSKATKKTS